MTDNLRIRGIVRTATTAKNLLKIGIKASEAAKFKQYIQSNLETIENICAQAGSQPHQLPTRSRNAYYFLKEIDLDNLPIVSSESEQIPTVKTPPTIRLKNIVRQQKIILEEIFYLADTPNSANIDRLIQDLNSNVTVIETICQDRQATPANLSNASRQIYAWMKFLTNPLSLEKHLIATRKAKKITQKIAQANSIKSEGIFIAFTNMVSLYRGKKDRHQYKITLNEGFIKANEGIITAIITAIIESKSRETTQIINQYVLTEEYSNMLLELDLIADIEADNAQGQCYNLDQLFERINSQYFDSSLSKPRLSWSQSLTRRKFGHYEANRDRVVISLTLDNSNVPAFVTEFVLYHELLHKYYGEKWVNGQRRVHTPEFKQLEQQFEFYQEAEAWLQKLTHLAEL